MTPEMTNWDEAVEYGHHLKGVLPDGTVTGVLCHPSENVFFKSYMEGPEHPRYPRWEREYQKTPLHEALEKFAKEGPTADLILKPVKYNDNIYYYGSMEGGCFTGWKYEYERKLSFRRSVLRGEIELPAPALFNKYGNVWIQEPHGEDVRELYWDFIDNSYDNRMSHYAATKS